MSNILKVTHLPTGYETSTRTNPITNNDTNIKNVVKTGTVNRADNRNEMDSGGKTNRYLESNFEKFLQTASKTPGVSDTAKDMIFSRMEMVVSSGISENYAKEISEFIELMKMDEIKLLNYLKGSGLDTVKFTGIFFDTLRELFPQSQEELQGSILEFLRKYNDMTSGGRILESIKGNLEEMLKYMPNRYKGDLESLMQDIDFGATGGKTEENMELFKNKMIPYLSKYVSQTNDLGRLRDIISLLTINIVRYESGNREGLIQVFENMLGYTGFRDKFGAMSSTDIDFLLSQLELENNNKTPQIMDKFLQILGRGINGEAGMESKMAFEQILNAMLLNESVYMPLSHHILPLEMFGKKMFSEIWVDPEGHGEEIDGEKAVKLLIKFDIEELGMFDLIVSTAKGKVDMQIFCPQKLEKNKRIIKNEITEIVKKNNMSIKNLGIENNIDPKTVSEVFPKIFERNSSVNVKV